jgi:hypothetical protein
LNQIFRARIDACRKTIQMRMSQIVVDLIATIDFDILPGCTLPRRVPSRSHAPHRLL